MAKKTKKAPAKNFVIETILKSKGRGKNKQTTATAKKERFQKRLYCLPVAPAVGKGKASKRAKRFECFGNLEDAMAAFAVGMGRGLPVPEARPPAFSPKSMAEMEKAMKGLRGALPARGLRGTPEEHRARARDLETKLARAREVDREIPGIFAPLTIEQIAERRMAQIEENYGWAGDLPWFDRG